MYAVIGEATIEPARIEESLRDLDDTLMPFVTQAPGFVRGYWLRSPDGVTAMSVLLFDTEAAASAMCERRPANADDDGPARGVSLRVLEVVRTGDPPTERRDPGPVGG